jgi:rhodanese-related sulfurtransferase
VIDVRTPQEHQECDIIASLMSQAQTNVLNVSVGTLTHMNKTKLEEMYGIRRNQTILCICKIGKRSSQAQKYLSNMGYDSFSVFGGLAAFA